MQRLLLKIINLPFLLPLFLFALFLFIFSYHSIYKHLNFDSNAFDLGIYVQGMHLYTQTPLPFSTLMHIPLLSDHFGPILILFAPLYAIFPSASTLLIIQALLVSLSSIPIYLIAQKHLNNRLLSFLLMLAYLSAPGILSGINFDFHLATISVFPISLLLYAWYFKKWRFYLLSLFLCLLFKEDVTIFIFGLGLYQIFQKQKRLGIFTSFFGIAGFYFIKFKIMPFFWQGTQEYDINTSTLPLLDPLALLYLFWLRPTIFIDTFFNSPIKIQTIDSLLRQFAFLPVLSPFSFFMILPDLFLRFSSVGQNYWSSSFQYNANLTPSLAVSAILAIRRFKIPASAVTILLLFFLLTGGLSPHSLVWSSLRLRHHNPQKFSYLSRALETIPPEAAVSAQSPIVPQIGNREKFICFRKSMMLLILS